VTDSVQSRFFGNVGERVRVEGRPFGPVEVQPVESVEVAFSHRQICGFDGAL